MPKLLHSITFTVTGLAAVGLVMFEVGASPAEAAPPRRSNR